MTLDDAVQRDGRWCAPADELPRLFNEAVSRIRQLQGDLDTLRKAGATVVGSQDSFMALCSAHSVLAHETDKALAENLSLKTENDRLKAENEKILAQIYVSANEELDDVRLQQLEVENERLKSEIKELKETWTQAVTRIRGMRSEMDALRFVEKCIKDTEAENERLKAIVCEQKNEINRLKETDFECGKLNVKNDALKARVAELEERLNSPSTFNADSVREQR